MPNDKKEPNLVDADSAKGRGFPQIRPQVAGFTGPRARATVIGAAGPDETTMKPCAPPCSTASPTTAAKPLVRDSMAVPGNLDNETTSASLEEPPQPPFAEAPCTFVISARENFLEVLVVAAVFVAINVLSLLFQEPLSFEQGRGWDGEEYYKLAEQLVQRTTPTLDSPYVYRFGTSLLVATFFPNNLLHGFFVVNLCGNALFVVLLVLWFRFYVRDWRLRVFLAALFMASWHTQVRFVYFYPTLTDNWANVFMLAGLIMIECLRRRPSLVVLSALSAITFAGVCFRENMTLVPVAAWFVNNPIYWDAKSLVPLWFRRLPPIYLILPLLCAFLGIAWAHSGVHPTGVFSYPRAVYKCLVYKHPRLFIHDICLAYGVIPFILLYYWRRTLACLWERQFHLVFILSILVLTYIAGPDMVRFLGWGAPIVLLLLAGTLETQWQVLKSPWLLAFMGVCQAMSQRWFLATPDHFTPEHWPIPLLTPIGPNASYLSLYTPYTPTPTHLLGLSQYIVLGVLLVYWLHYRTVMQSRQ